MLMPFGFRHPAPRSLQRQGHDTAPVVHKTTGAVFRRLSDQEQDPELAVASDGGVEVLRHVVITLNAPQDDFELG